MAMTADGMADAIYTAMTAAYEGINNGEAETKKYLKVFTTGIVNYLKSNMDVLPGISVSTSGTSAAQTGATTAAGKVG